MTKISLIKTILSFAIVGLFMGYLLLATKEVILFLGGNISPSGHTTFIISSGNMFWWYSGLMVIVIILFRLFVWDMD